ncbi:hypothetical protein GmHk_07G019405 [Glycine max]|uniref:Uncharacterized protein n=1 Tax=Glycine soja TaxID=3848 RepID=A0A0B2RA22_GLYSO|nr:hypothetical protein GmHk_07G019405 [Glycine max]KHN28778.1 hypothetical protein glysoja_040212 [Glycine soja]
MAGKQSKARKPEVFGKGKVTPTQIAFIVDRYLCDNNFSSTRSTFRNEASSLISHSPIHEAPKTLLTLGEMLDEYICLKEQKVMLNQERAAVEQEKNRVQMLLQGMHNVMTAYNASGNLPAPASAAKSAVVTVPQPTFGYKSQPGNPTSVQIKSNAPPLPQSSNSNVEGGNFSTPTLNVCDRKRKDTKAVDAPSAAKKPRGRSSSRKIVVQGQNALQQSDKAVNNTMVAQPSTIQSSSEKCIPRESQVQGYNVAKCLFNRSTTSVPSNSPVPKTPPRTKSSHSDTHISPAEVSSVATCNRAVTPSHCTVISTKRVMVSPAKQMAYIEMSHCISPVKTNSEKVSKRDHVRSRLNFDAADVPGRLDNPLPNEISTSESEKELDIFDIEFPNFDALGTDFSFTEMLNDLDFSCEGMDFSCHPTPSPSMDNASGSSHECNGNHATPELSTVAEVLCEKDMKILGPDCMTAMKSVTKNITVISPGKFIFSIIL